MDKEKFRVLCQMAVINAKRLDATQALDVQALYPKWENYIGKEIKKSETPYVVYSGKLYEVLQDVPSVLESQPPGVDTAALYKRIDKEHAGTQDDPIPYEPNMELYNGKYYTEDEVLYLCNQDTGQAVYNKLSELVGIYVKVAE